MQCVQRRCRASSKKALRHLAVLVEEGCAEPGEGGSACWKHPKKWWPTSTCSYVCAHHSTLVYQPCHRGVETFPAGVSSLVGCGILYFPMTKFPNFLPAECLDERHLPSPCQGRLCGQVMCCLGKGVCCQPWLSWWAGGCQKGWGQTGDDHGQRGERPWGVSGRDLVLPVVWHCGMCWPHTDQEEWLPLGLLKEGSHKGSYINILIRWNTECPSEKKETSP